jgi:hypothetical protein
MSDLLNSASLVMIPSGYKEDIVYSAVPTDGSGDLSFTRASNGTRVNSAGLVEVTPWNLVQNSENFSAIWTNQNSTITTNSIVAPNGTTTADSLIGSNGSGAMGVYVAETTSVVKTLSCYVKKGSKRWAAFIAYNGNSNCWFDLDNGIVGTRGAYYSASSITSVGNGWYRIDAVMTTAIGAETNIGIYATNNDNDLNCTGDGTTVLSYIWGFQCNIGSTAKPYFPTTDRLNVPRLTYQNGGGGCPSLLLEKQSTNIAIYSEQFNDASWGKSNITVTANDAISPDGTQNADKITSTNASNTIQLAVSSSSGVDYTISVFAKNIDAGNVRLDMSNVAFGPVFTFATKTFTTVSGWTTSYQEFSNGWFRLIATRQSNSTSASPQFGLDSVVGSVYFWGAQFEQSSYPTSYISTTSASATRVADFAITNNISSLFGSTEGSFFIEMTHDGTNANGAIPLFLRSSIGAAFNRATYLQFGTTNITLEVYNGGTSQAIISGGSFTNGQTLKVACGYKSNDFVLYVNGVQIGTDTSGSISASLAFIDFGTYNLAASTFQYNGKIGETILFPTRLTNAELASLTTV